MARKEKLKKVTKSLFNRFFGFENGVDITSEVAVLHRRNAVIKNIILLSNMFYSLILFLVAFISDKSADWLFPALFVPFTFFLNAVIKRLIFTDRHDLGKQQIGMYVMALYAFISVILFYARFYNDAYLEASTYVLIYYALIVISLYQSKSLILWSSFGLFGAMTIIHFTWTYQIDAQNMEIIEFLKFFVKHDSFSDLLLRTLAFVLFVVVVYSIVSIGHYMQEQRKLELMKRQEIQDDYTTIVSDLLGMVLGSKGSFLDFQHNALVNKISKHLASLYNYTEEEIEELEKFINIYLKIDEIEELAKPKKEKEIPFEQLKAKTRLATKIAKRIQLAQKAEDIARAHIDNAATHEFIVEMQGIQPDLDSQIILLADLYITMRSPRRYKRAYPDQVVKNLFKEEFSYYFKYELLDRFLRFEKDFTQLFDENY